MSQMDKVTQQNAANAEESAGASEELSAQAKELDELVKQLSRLIGGKGTQRKTSSKTKTLTLGAADAAYHQIAHRPHESIEEDVFPLV